MSVLRECAPVLLVLTVLLAPSVPGRIARAQPPEKGVPASEPDELSRRALLPMSKIVKPQSCGLEADEVEFANATGQTLRGWFFDAPDTDRTVLVCMGNTGNASFMLPYVKPLFEAGLDVLIFNYQGFPKSDGQISVFSLLGDAEAAYRYLREVRDREEKDIAVFGISLGSVLAIALASNHRPAALAIEDVFLPGEMLDQMVPRNASLGQKLLVQSVKALVLPKLEPLLTMRRVKCPVFLFHGVEDQLLPAWGTVRLAQVRPPSTRVWMIANAGHAPGTLDLNDREYVHQLVSFFREAFETGGIKVLSPRIVSSTPEREGATRSVTVELDAPPSPPGQKTDGSRPRIPIEICVADIEGHFAFARRWLEGDSLSVTISTEFEPVHCSAIQVGFASDLGDGHFAPDLSFLSESLVSFRRFLAEYARKMPLERVQVEQRWIRRPTRAHWLWVRKRIPPTDQLHPRIRPRYANFLADLAFRLEPWEPAAVPEITEAILPYLPSDPTTYFELGDASFRVGFSSVRIARLLYRTAEARIRNPEELEEARRRLLLYRSILPDFFEPLITKDELEGLSPATELPSAGKEKFRPERFQ